MQAGQLRYRVKIEQPVETQNEYGEPITAWSTLATVWASKTDLTGREYFAAQQVQSEVTTRFVIRYRDDVTAKMRIEHNGQTYNIESVQAPDPTRLILLCSRTNGTA